MTQQEKSSPLTPSQLILLNKVTQPAYMTCLFIVLLYKLIPLALPYIAVIAYLLSLTVRHALILPKLIIPHFTANVFQNADHNYYALITGGAHGIGLGYAKKFARDNFNVIIVGRDNERLQNAKKLIQSAYHVKVIAIDQDLSERGSIQKLAQRINQEDSGAKVIHLVNNAGYGSYGEFVKLDIKNELSMVDLNIAALMELCHHYGNEMMKLKADKSNADITPRITNIGSVSSYMPNPNGSTYAATKSFVLSFSLGLAQELAQYGITVTAVCPGTVDTEFFDVAKSKHTFFIKNSIKATIEELVDETYPQMMTGQLFSLNTFANNFVATYSQFFDIICTKANLLIVHKLFR